MVMMKTLKTAVTAANPKTLPSTSGSTDNVSANIKVVVRVRPPNQREQAGNSRNVIDIVDDKMLEFDPKEDAKPFFYQGVQQQTKHFLKRPNKQLKFMFDSVFGPSHTNEDVFKATTKHTITSLMEGFNCSVFVYGATGAGKTFTMIGNKEQLGITYLTMDYLFNVIESFKEERDFDICVSYLEVYNENVFDLLNARKNPLQLREDAKFGVVVAGLTINCINTAAELLEMLEKGNKNRTQHPTDANAESSRSHAVFQVYVKMRYKTSGSVRMVKLSMIDLAGSERASATGCSGDRFKEGANINRSLLSLANCINKLADGCKYIPYRDSKLTRLLKDSLGGNCQTIMIANISPSSLTYEDTYNTLKYASRANNIQLSIKKNVADCNTHVAEYVKIIEELRKQVKDLQAKLTNVTKLHVVKKEPEPTPAKSKAPEWRNKLQTEFNVLMGIEKKLLHLISQQKVLVMRQRLKQKSREQLSYLCDDTDDEQLEEVCQKDIPRQEQAIEHFSRQISIIQNKLQSLSNRRNLSNNRFVTLCLQAKLESPELADFVEKLKMSLELNLIQARDEHKTKLLDMQRQEMSSSASFLKDMPNMLKKLYLILKGYGKITPCLSEEYADIMRKAKSSRAVTWEDESTGELDESQFKFMVNLDFDVSECTPKFSIKTEPPKTPPHIVLDSDSDVENKFTLKRKATPKVKKTVINSTVVLDDSSILDEDNLDETKTISPAKKPHLTSFKKVEFEVEKDFKTVDPNDLNSTFVMAAKMDSVKKLPISKQPEVRQVLKERGNVRVPERNLLKTAAQQSKPIVGKAFPLRRAAPPSGTPHQSNKVAFGSTTARSNPNFAKPKDIQVMRGRERAGTHPYSRPHTAPSARVPPHQQAPQQVPTNASRR